MNLKHLDQKQVDVVINYYNPSKSEQLRYQTLHCLFCYMQEDVNVILSDGSGFKDDSLAQLSQEKMFIYLWSEKKLSFAEGYNQGIDYSIKNFPTSYICLSANDIFPRADCLSKMLDVLRADNNIGCVIPYLSYSDYSIQNDRYLKRLRFCDCMTLNCNLFPKEVLDSIGRVPDYLSGYFNDVVMFAELCKLGKKVALCDAGVVLHIGKATVQKSTTAFMERDRNIFNERHPNLAPINPYIEVKQSVFSQTLAARIFYIFLEANKSRLLTEFLRRLQLLFFSLEEIIVSFMLTIYELIVNLFPRSKPIFVACKMLIAKSK